MGDFHTNDTLTRMLTERGEPRRDGNHEPKSMEQVREDGNIEDEIRDGHTRLGGLYIWFCTILLLVNYFLAQYDKFILSYFQTPLSESLNL